MSCHCCHCILWSLSLYPLPTVSVSTAQFTIEPGSLLASHHGRSGCRVQVQAILESFVQKSDIRTLLNVDGGQKLFETDFIAKNESNVLPVLGYFALVGLSRYMCLLGQHEDCLKALAPLNPFNKQFLYTLKVRSSHTFSDLWHRAYATIQERHHLLLALTTFATAVAYTRAMGRPCVCVCPCALLPGPAAGPCCRANADTLRALHPCRCQCQTSACTTTPVQRT